MGKRKWIKCLTVLLAVFLYAGCTLPPVESEGGGAVQYGTVEESEYTANSIALRIGYDTELTTMQPLYMDTAIDRDIAGLTQETLFATDRSGMIVKQGIEGESVSYNGVAYTYQGLADVEIEQDQKNDMTIYHITLREDAKFADGETVDADDLIFTLYLLSDTSYDGPYTLYQAPIMGMTNYRLDAPADVTVEEEEIDQALEEMRGELADMITREIIKPVLEEEFAWCQSLYESSDYDMLTSQYDTPEALFLHFYGLSESYEEMEEGVDAAELAAGEYGGDYRRLGQICGKDTGLYEETARKIAAEYVIAEKIASGQNGKAPNISGIHRVNAHKVDIYTNGYDESCIYQLNVPVLPLHYYGEESLYDYSENQFGFTKGDLSGILAQNKLPMGAGAYRLISEQQGSLYLSANQEYYKGEPSISSLLFLPVKEEDKIPLISKGEIDVVQMGDSQENLELIQAQNSNGAITGDVIYTSLSNALGYGYIGMNSETVNIGGKADSKASIALRTGLAVIFAYYREEAVNAYFGGTTSVLNYPMSEDFIVSPKPSDQGYQTAYAKDVSGYSIYEEDMEEEDRKQAMEEAVLEYFKEAGYTVKGNRITKAPEGGSMSFTVVVAGESPGGTAFYELLTAAEAHLEQLGIELDIQDTGTQELLEKELAGDEYQIWCDVREEKIYPDLYSVYGSMDTLGEKKAEENRYHLSNRKLDELLIALKKESKLENARKMYYECLELILEQAVEVPVYQCRNYVLFSGQTVDTDTIADDMTGFYQWIEEIELLQLNGKE